MLGKSVLHKVCYAYVKEIRDHVFKSSNLSGREKINKAFNPTFVQNFIQFFGTMATSVSE